MASWPLPKKSRRGIAKTRKWITVLFTDIVDSTQHWHELGDIEARVQLDQHDRLLKGVVFEFGGTVVKTIGDSLMVTFEEPDNAIRSAIAMQHLLEEKRQKDSSFELKIRIGIHRGRALVEEDDVYGNTVNVAARVESQAGSGEILISDGLTTAVDLEAYSLSRIGSFVPKGKTASLLLYRVNWWREESRLDALVPEAAPESVAEPAITIDADQESAQAERRQPNKHPRRVFETLLLLTSLMSGVLAMAHRIAPPLLVDHPGLASLLLNPLSTLARYPAESMAIFSGAAVFVGVLILIPFTRGLTRIFIRGGAALSFVGVGSFLMIEALPAAVEWPGDKTFTVFEAPETRWVEVRGQDHAPGEIRVLPSGEEKLMMTAGIGERFVLVQGDGAAYEDWIEVHLAPRQTGWLAMRESSSVSSPEGQAGQHRIRRAEGVRLGGSEAYALAAGLVAAVIAVLLGWWRDWHSGRVLLESDDPDNRLATSESSAGL